MDQESRAAQDLLKVLASSSERFNSFAASLRHRPEVAEVRKGFDLRGYTSGPMVEAYVDATLHNGDSVCWWLELSWDNDGSWHIENKVLHTHREGQDNLQEFPEKTASSLRVLMDQWDRATSELIESSDWIKAMSS